MHRQSLTESMLIHPYIAWEILYMLLSIKEILS